MNESPHLDRLQDGGALEAQGVEVVYVSDRARRVLAAIAILQGPGISWSSDRPREEIADAMRAAGEEPLSEGVISRAIRDAQRAGLLLVQRKAKPNARVFVYYLSTASPTGRPYVIRSSEALREAREAIRGARIHASTRPSTREQQHTSQIHEGGCCSDQGGAHTAAPTTSSSVVVGPQQQPSQGEQQSHRQQHPPSTAEGIGGWPSDRHAAIAYRLRRLGIEARDRGLVEDLASAPQRALDGFDLTNGGRCPGVWERLDRYQARTPEYARQCLDSTLDVLIAHPAAAGADTAASASSRPTRPLRGLAGRIARATRAAVSELMRADQ